VLVDYMEEIPPDQGNDPEDGTPQQTPGAAPQDDYFSPMDDNDPFFGSFDMESRRVLLSGQISQATGIGAVFSTDDKQSIHVGSQGNDFLLPSFR